MSLGAKLGEQDVLHEETYTACQRRAPGKLPLSWHKAVGDIGRLYLFFALFQDHILIFFHVLTFVSFTLLCVRALTLLKNQ